MFFNFTVSLPDGLSLSGVGVYDFAFGLSDYVAAQLEIKTTVPRGLSRFIKIQTDHT